MHTGIKVVLGTIICVAVALGAVAWMAYPDWQKDRKSQAPAKAAIPSVTVAEKRTGASEPPKPSGIFIDKAPFEEGGLAYAAIYTGPIRNSNSLKELRDAIQLRGRLGLKVLGAELDQLHIGPKSPKDQLVYAVKLHKTLALLAMYDGQFDAADVSLAKALTVGQSAGQSWKDRTELEAIRGIVALRQGEVSNCIACVGPSSCIFPIAPEAAHKQQEGSRKAIQYFTAYLDELPGDLRVRWLLNIAYMTLGEYPDKVPPKYLIPIETFRSTVDVGKFQNVAVAAGLTSRGPNMAGGSVFDDFTGDGLPDLFTTSLDGDRGASLFVNRGDGSFQDRATAAGLDDQVYSLNVTRADYDNDGDLDVLLLRGAWDVPMRLSLLKNKGDGTFEDVTLSSGFGEPISSESAAWGDFDNDGLVDVYVCGEYYPPTGKTPGFEPNPRNRCRLYRNRGDGTFEDVAAKAGVVNLSCAKGSAWGDYDGDGRLDLFVSNMDGPSRLYHNEGKGTFKDVAPTLDVTADGGFACWFFDYDNDGLLDLYVNGKGVSLAEEVAYALKMLPEQPIHPRLFRNLGAAGFRDVTKEIGLDRPSTPMGCNIGDIDNDGYLDIYLGTGGMSYGHLVPNILYKNMAGKRFEDVTMSSATGHLQKGHGISFADWDCDGDLDLFVEAGGAVPGDSAFNILFQNPLKGRHWLKVKLIGTKTNRSALGARIRVVVKNGDGTRQTIYRTVGNNSSFGGNSLVELIGLSQATTVEELEVLWPTSEEKQNFRDIAADQAIEITEGAKELKTLVQPSFATPKR